MGRDFHHVSGYRGSGFQLGMSFERRQDAPSLKLRLRLYSDPRAVSSLEIVQELRPRLDSRDEQLIPRSRAGDVEELSLRVVDLLQIIFPRFLMNSRLREYEKTLFDIYIIK